MKVQFTLTTELPTFCVGLFETRQEAEAFLQECDIKGAVVTPVFSS